MAEQGPAAVRERGPVAEAISFARQRKGLRQRPLALRAGLGKSYVNKLEVLNLQPSLLAFARLASVLKLTPMEVWAIVMAEAHHASDGCPRCGGRGEILLPRGDDLEEYACPLCRPWPDGFAGESANGRWIIPPYGPGEPPEYRGWERAS